MQSVILTVALPLRRIPFHLTPPHPTPPHRLHRPDYFHYYYHHLHSTALNPAPFLSGCCSISVKEFDSAPGRIDKLRGPEGVVQLAYTLHDESTVRGQICGLGWLGAGWVVPGWARPVLNFMAEPFP